MPLALPNNLKSLTKSGTLRFSTCWKVVRKDGFQLRLTDHNASLTVLNERYVPMGGFNPSARRRQEGLKDQDMDLIGVLDDNAITFDDLHARRYDGAKVREILVDWRYDFAGAFQITDYVVTRVRFNGILWEAEVTGLTYLLRHAVGDVYSRDCSRDLGDAFGLSGIPGCKFDVVGNSTSQVRVNASADRAHFDAFDADIPGGFSAQTNFTLGFVLWSTGANQGIRSEIKEYRDTNREFDLLIEVPFNIQQDDEFTAFPGCDKTLPTCRDVYDQVVNHFGFPYMPGADELLKGPSRV